ncbi:glycosyltransferase family 4 protein [Halosimplex sp. J119]
MKERRICFISPNAYGYFVDDYEMAGGGAERQFYYISEYLSTDFDVRFIVADFGQAKREEFDGITLHRSHSPDDPRYKVLMRYWRVINEIDADVYIYRGAPQGASILYPIVKMQGKQWIYHIANDQNISGRPEKLNPVFQRLFHRCMENADEVIAQTDKQSRMINTRYSTEPTVIENGYPSVSGRCTRGQRDSFIWVGRMEREQKQPHKFVELADQVPGYDFKLIGPPSSSKEYQSQVEEAVAEHANIEYLGAIDPDNIHEYFKSAIAFVNTSQYEGFPNTFLESWRYGTPVLSLEIDPERFLPQDGYSDSDGDVDQLATDVKAIAEDSSYDTISTRIQSRFEESYTISQIGEKYQELLERSL